VVDGIGAMWSGEKARSIRPPVPPLPRVPRRPYTTARRSCSTCYRGGDPLSTESRVACGCWTATHA